MNWSPTPLEFAPGLWRALMRDLWTRGGEQREAGAFLVASRRQPQIVRRWISYADLDANSLQYAYVKLEPSAFSRLSELCTALDLRVTGDIHTHPHAPVQSESDREHPMISIPGHIALIAPRFASGTITPADVSFNVYRGAGRWSSFLGHDAAALIIAP
jgi:proteasome lid subunit RPN8/RPN11